MKSVGEAMASGRTFKEGEHTRPACCIRRRAGCSLSFTIVSGVEAGNRRPEARAPHCSLEIGPSGLGGNGKPRCIRT